MHQLTALRPLVTAGAAAVGASLIALTPAVSNDAASALQHSVAAAQQRAVELLSADTGDPGVVNPIQTWINVFQQAGMNLQEIGSNMSHGGAIPFPLAQQLAADWVTYASIYVGGVSNAYKGAVNGAYAYFTNTGQFTESVYFWLTSAISSFQQADFINGFEDLYQMLWFAPAYAIFQPMESIPTILAYMSTNFAALGNVAFNEPFQTSTSIVSMLGAFFAVGVGQSVASALGVGVQNVYDGFAAGDLPAGVSNLLNMPGMLAGAVINGYNPQGALGGTGILSPTSSLLSPGLLNTLVAWIPQTLASNIVVNNQVFGTITTPNILEGGSLANAFSQLASQVTTGWPTPNMWVNGLLNAYQSFLGFLGGQVGLGGAAFTAPAGVASIAPSLAANLGGIAPSIAADFSGIAPSLAADLSGLAPSLATNLAGTLAPKLGTLAAHILTSLF
ncbi:hypothetical protein H7H82_06730 [Mycobacterium heidelbergense]|uniref:Uncharacterized protein n=1 Tax=Mycobacterium heidelbergense TaxID=53376 RepID=A0A1X0D6C5_MYCHE|nr:hypothetical protein [Mycobacterium heidelbergense]MCV7050298.1 hypothetical protein [Mycobacterium heidelbergense]ORA67732.1 hypothetical protein BST25_22560 [Mycobacterium heidelbergense]BBZ50528.1 hypothetical protein MHEI_22450 [Mycobacterium heidelbergense]